MLCIRFPLLLMFVFCRSFANSQLYNQNGTAMPYPYQISLGLAPSQGLRFSGTQNMGIPYPYAGNYITPNTTQSFNNYNAILAQQGRPAYLGVGMGYPQPGIGYPQPAYGYPSFGGGFPQHGIGYPQPSLGYPTSGGFGYTYPGPGITYPQQGVGNTYYAQGGHVQPISDPYANIKAEIIDVDPEFHRKVLGWPSDNVSAGSSGANSRGTIEGSKNQKNQGIQPRYTVKADSQTSNFTSIPSNLTKPIVTTKKFTTSIRRTFVSDSTKPGENKPINLHFINGEPVTTTPPPTTTENEDVEGSSVTPKGRRFMDVPASCPKGTTMGHKGECMQPFLFANFPISKVGSVENTTQAPIVDENETEAI